MFKILDLFSGAGGLSYGIGMSKEFNTVVAVDYNKPAIETFKFNHNNTYTILGDMTNVDIKNEIIHQSKKLGVNMVIGGPPCQGFSNKGKNLGLNDERNFLFLEYIEIVKNISPKIFIIENVKPIITAANGYFINEIINKFSDLGYLVNYKIVNSEDFGVPQKRERAFIIGCKDFKFNFNTLYKYKQKKVTVRDAISDLNFLESGEGAFEAEYKINYLSDYQKTLRENCNKLFNHTATNHSEKAIEKLKMIPPEKGKEFLPKELLGKQKFKTTWSRLEWDKVSPTIDTRFDTPSNGKNSHPVLNRAITPREAARLQSFPDKFVFIGNKTEICKQVGNAVPPMLANYIGKSILDQYKLNDCKKIEHTNFKIYNSDAYNLINIFKKNKVLVNHIITDPPYSISTENNFSTMKNKRAGVYFGDWDNSFDLLNWIKPYSEILDKNGSFIIFCSYKFISYIVDELENCGMIVKDFIEWKKTNPMPRNINRRYVQDTEFAVWAVKKNSKWTFNKPKEIPYLRSCFYYPTVSGKERTNHPTQKSLKLMEDIINIHTNQNDLILDPFMGSGTTGVACIKNNRKFIGIELDYSFFEIANERIKNIEN